MKKKYIVAGILAAAGVICAVIRQIKRCLLRQIKTGFTEHLTMV